MKYVSPIHAASVAEISILKQVLTRRARLCCGLLAVAAALFVSCGQHGPLVSDWETVSTLPDGEKPHVEVYEVEFLPTLPQTPGTVVVGYFRIRNGAELQYDNEAVVSLIKQRAALMGGNTIVYPHNKITKAVVAYVPTEPNLHGGDEY
ncbi:MAG: hypothetical protein IKC90_08045 [Akkermansia sp.]|nr:hypothetical protein [Akkermansia sp.]